MHERSPETQNEIFWQGTAKVNASRIVAVLDSQNRRVFNTQDLNKLLNQHRDDWQVRSDVGPKQFSEYLGKQFEFRRIVLRGTSHQTQFIRFLWRKPLLLEVAASMRSTAYLSHSSAVLVHELNTQFPHVLYVNYEQSEKPRPDGGLTQENMDRAFRGKQRECTFSFSHEGQEMILLSGKQTGDLGVERTAIDGTHEVRVTDLERTLIDITVRPTYAGGVHQVLEAYEIAKDRVSIPKLVKILEQLDYVYPYHQAVGFYLSRAGHRERDLKLLRNLGLNYDFYLAHNMKSTVFDRSWRLHHPDGM